VPYTQSLQGPGILLSKNDNVVVELVGVVDMLTDGLEFEMKQQSPKSDRTIHSLPIAENVYYYGSILEQYNKKKIFKNPCFDTLSVN
jgi:hypothetical protein